MKKVLIVSASTRKSGNTAALYSHFAKGAQENGNVVEREFLADKRIEYCSGCGRCDRTKHCMINDDARRTLERMTWADVIVLATPVEFYSMDVQMQRLLDRLRPCREALSKKTFYFILTSRHMEKKALDQVLETFRRYMKENLPGAVEAGFILGTEHGTDEKGRAAAMETAYQMGAGV